MTELTEHELRKRQKVIASMRAEIANIERFKQEAKAHRERKKEQYAKDHPPDTTLEAAREAQERLKQAVKDQHEYRKEQVELSKPGVTYEHDDHGRRRLVKPAE